MAKEKKSNEVISEKKEYGSNYKNWKNAVQDVKRNSKVFQKIKFDVKYVSKENFN